MHYEDGSYYHVYNRGARKGLLFFNPANYRYLISLFVKNSMRYDVVVAAYCLMPNHYHLLLRQDVGGSISSFLRTTFNTYTQSINARYSMSGTLFQGQARSRRIISDTYCIEVVRYLHLNPIKARLTLHPKDWPYSNYLEWIGERKSPLFDVCLRDEYFANAEGYKRFIEEYMSGLDNGLLNATMFPEERE